VSKNHCAQLIHYEIPWNPNRMEQRNGRIDRHGQRAPEVLVHHFVGAGYANRPPSLIREPGDLDGDLEFLLRAARKVETIREDLGKVGPVIARQVEEAMLGKRGRLDTVAAERDAGAVRNVLRVERRLREQMARLYEQLKETERDLRLAPDNIEQVVAIGLRLAGQPPLRPAKVPGLWPDPTGHRHSPPVFHMPALKGSWAACSEGLQHPHTGQTRPIVFDHNLARGRDDVVLAHLGHRLVQTCVRLLRAEIWSIEGQRKLRRVTARLVPDRALETPAVIAHGRLVVLGADGARLHEEVIAAGGVLRAGRFARMNVGEVKSALDAARPDPAPEAIQQRLAALWPGHAEALDNALKARMADRTNSLARSLEERAEKEIADKATILGELRRAILDELHEPESRQLALFSNVEQEQLQRNIDSLRRRADEIPAEIERERQATLARYADPTPHLFPVAVTYLVPESIARREGP